MNSKKTIREKILTDRININEDVFVIKNKLIIENVRAILKSSYKDQQVIGLYFPIEGEVDLTKIMFYNNGQLFALPKINGNNMYFIRYHAGDQLEKEQSIVIQPTSTTKVVPNIIVAPALAYSQEGYRLGFGLGYYDKYLAAQQKLGNDDILKIGVCLDKYLLEFLPTEKHDIKFDYIVTEEVILKL